MTNEEFQHFMEKLDAMASSVLLDRKVAYSGEDRLENFKQIAELTGLHPAQVCLCLVGKHIIALAKAVREGNLNINRNLDYIVDIINYHRLLWGILNDQQMGSVLPGAGASGGVKQSMPKPSDRGAVDKGQTSTIIGVQRPSGGYAPLQREGE